MEETLRERGVTTPTPEGAVCVCKYTDRKCLINWILHCKWFSSEQRKP